MSSPGTVAENSPACSCADFVTSSYAIDIQQDYENGGATGEPTTAITVSNVVFENISGDVTDDGYQYYILCGSTSSCSDITFTDIDITGGTTECTPSSLCSGA